ncbi:TetR/AcrR family transcriptional regulator [Celeribacter naphthalenivorans]|uniref:TetR/AcrR family transcriptional regulator n=1 Tax=Celeribacter naphthalenivorans TaxID=1614694 RepID=UPI001CF9545A|nr:TetR/AcrR family transcriptional regulator [Celeribacter naphthalenivorans]
MVSETKTEPAQAGVRGRSQGRSQGRSWKQDPETVKADILNAARAEFAAHGLSGARISAIVERTQTSKRMIFYYFGDKESLYLAVLDQAYREVREAEANLDIRHLPPDEALRKVVEFTFDHHRNNPDFIRLVMIENIHDGNHMSRIQTLATTNIAAIDQLDRICRRGIEAGLFRPDVSPLVIHWQISAMSFFNVANRATFSMNFGDDLFAEDAQLMLREQVVQSISSSVLRPDRV